MYQIRIFDRIGKKVPKGKRFGRQLRCILLCLLIANVSAGCAPAPSEEEEELVVMEQEEEAIPYNLAIASYGDVLLTEIMNGIYRELEEEELSFSVSGRLVTQVYVEEGAKVRKGQLLADLGMEDLTGQAETLEYQIERNKILLEHTAINEDYDLSTIWLQFIYQSGRTEAERKALDTRIAEIQQQYRYMREDLQDAIDIAELKLKEIRNELAVTKLYAGMDGTVTWIAPWLYGSTSEAGKEVIQIKNDSECIFTIAETKNAALFEEGIPVEMVVASGESAGTYLVMPYHMEEWTDRLMFAMVQEDVEMQKGAIGRITMLLDSRENVLNIPKRAIHTINGQTFVFYLGEDGLRDVRWVETGLYGDDRVEILSGLQEGERVILK